MPRITDRPPSRRGRVALLVLFGSSVLLCAKISGVDIPLLWDHEGADSASQVLSALTHPDLSNDFLWRVAKLSLESLLIGVLGTSMAVLLGTLLALLAIKVPSLANAPRLPRSLLLAGGSLRFAVRGVLGVARAIPTIVWAYLFVRTIGLGPGPAVLAIAVSTGGIVGKLYAELAEAVDPASLHALRRAGCGRFAVLLYGVLPSVWRQWLSYGLFRLECSIRSASILGIVGAGGLGSEIALSIRYFEYDKLATTLLAVLVFVVAIEILSGLLRRRALRWSMAVALGGSVLALIYLKIPWSEIRLGQLVPDWLLKPGRGDTSEFLLEALKLSGETLAIAWSATMVAGVLALVISPMAAATLSVRSHSQESVQGKGAGRLLRWVYFVTSRLLLQVCRAMPELTLALIFVLWVGPGPFAGFLAIALHNVGVLGRLYTDVYEEVDAKPVVALESGGSGRMGVWLYAVFPQVTPKLLAFTLYRFEVNVRATAMIGFVGAGGLGDSIHTSISLFHGRDLLLLLGVMVALVTLLDFIGDWTRHRLLTARFSSPRSTSSIGHGAGVVVGTSDSGG